MIDLDTLADRWIQAKKTESKAVEERRRLEDEIAARLDVSESFEGTLHAGSAYDIKVTARMTRKVDSDLVQEIAAEHGLADHLSHLFRWKAEVDAKTWANADERITKPLEAAITTKQGRPSFAITIKE